MRNPYWRSFTRLFKFALFRGLSLFFAIVVSVWLTITVAANSGVLESEISGTQIGGWFSGIMRTGARAPGVDFAPYQGTLRETVDLMIRGLTLNLGDTNIVYMYHNQGMLSDIRGLIVDFMSRTLFLFGFANLVLLIVSISIALLLYRHYGSFFDRLVVTLSPLSSVPAWLYGLVLVIFAARVLHIFPTALMDEWPATLTWSSVVYVMKSMLPPMLAIFISKIFQSIYLWRTFFLMHASEDYVEMGKAKGLTNQVIDRQYVVRPALPSLLTSFATMITGIWQEAIILELFFGVAGIGHLFYIALRNARTEMLLLIGLTVTFAYLQAISIFILEIVYAFVDPRVQVEGQRVSSRPFQRRSIRRWFSGWKNVFSSKPRVSLPESRTRVPKSAAEKANISPKIHFRNWAENLLASVRSFVIEFIRYPTAIFGLLIVVLMVGVSVYTALVYPYPRATSEWRGEGNVWRNNPRAAAPVWVNWFSLRKLVETKMLSTENGTASKEVGTTTNDMTPVRMEFAFDYNYDEFPTELILRVKTQAGEKKIFVSPQWMMPDGRVINIRNFSTRKSSEQYFLLLEDVVQRKPLAEYRKIAWFSVENSNPPQPLKGRYVLRLDAFLFEPGTNIDAEVILHGQLYGLAGTDNQRRDLLVPLMWGTPVALVFGLVGALLASLTSMLLAAIGTWFGGWVDTLIQWLTEINMVLPTFPLLVLVYISISKNVWVILGLAVLLSIMNNAIKNYRAIFLQIKESGYIEAALAYGATNKRIIFSYLVPRIMPVLVPQLVIMAPGLLFLEATLAYLNISDPTLPTWGKLIQESIKGGALNGAYYQVLQPVGLLLITGLALSMIGFALDRILNPRLREM
jgi:peptide/nickel transport system permease protein